MTDAELAALLALGHETPAVEVKEGFARTADRLFWRVVRACLAMSNRRDGGFVIIGVKESAGGLDPTGFEAGALETWNHDDVAAGLAPYADPYVSLTTQRLTFKGQPVIVLTVREFADVPVICTADRLPELRIATLYVRAGTKPESVAVRDHAQLRELLDLATEKATRRFLALARSVGVTAQPSDDELFAAQLRDVRDAVR